MTTYSASINLTETSAHGGVYSYKVGTGGVVAGHPVKLDTTAPNTVVEATAPTDLVVGIARDTVPAGGVVAVLGNGCKVRVPYTLTLGSKVQVATGGGLANYSSGTCVGYVVESATNASVIRVHLIY